MQRCQFCGAEPPNYARFCPSCGRMLSASSEYRPTDESQVMLPGIQMPGMANGQIPPANVPMVQGSPQPGGVPIVQGTPSVPGTLPAGHAGYQNLAQAAPPHAAYSHRPYRPHLHTTASRLLAHTTSKWIILVIIAIVVLVSSGIAVLPFNLPDLPVLA